VHRLGGGPRWEPGWAAGSASGPRDLSSSAQACSGRHQQMGVRCQHSAQCAGRAGGHWLVGLGAGVFVRWRMHRLHRCLLSHGSWLIMDGLRHVLKLSCAGSSCV
jgi:hypothetical protein